MRRAGYLLRSQMHPYFTRAWDLVAIFTMSLVGAVVTALFVLLMGASAACAEELPATKAATGVDLAIKDYLLVDMGSFHRLSLTVENIGSEPVARGFDIDLEVRAAGDFSRVPARRGAALPPGLAPGRSRSFSFDIVDQYSGARLAAGAYQLTLSATHFDGTFAADTDWDNNWVDDAFVVASQAPHAPVFALRSHEPATAIPYELAEAVDVELTVFDRLGRKVRTLASGPQAAGAHRVEWDGRDEAGWAVAGGAYFYRLRIGAVAQARRLMLLQ